MITGVSHIGLAVKSIDETLAKWAVIFGAREIGRREIPELGQTSALVMIGGSRFELMEPLGEEGVIPAFLEKHGEGFHHISFHSDGLDQDRALMEQADVRIVGIPGEPVMFTHPRSTNGVVFEITDRPDEEGDG
jgi:methylmalonyl-CoA/ethylmalonyl-CoA epimerase